MLNSLASLKAIILASIIPIDPGYGNQGGHLDAGKNKEIADMAERLQGHGQHGRGRKTRARRTAGKIEITSGRRHSPHPCAVPEELLTKLGKMAQTEIKNKMGGGQARGTGQAKRRKPKRSRSRPAARSPRSTTSSKGADARASRLFYGRKDPGARDAAFPLISTAVKKDPITPRKIFFAGESIPPGKGQGRKRPA